LAYQNRRNSGENLPCPLSDNDDAKESKKLRERRPQFFHQPVGKFQSAHYKANKTSYNNKYCFLTVLPRQAVPFSSLGYFI